MIRAGLRLAAGAALATGCGAGLGIIATGACGAIVWIIATVRAILGSLPPPAAMARSASVRAPSLSLASMRDSA